VIHLIEAHQLAERYGFPIAATTPPIVGEGQPFQNSSHNRLLAGAILGALLITLRAVVQTRWGFLASRWVGRLLPARPRLRVVDETTVEPQLMV
jgi:hypothetical protein